MKKLISVFAVVLAVFGLAFVFSGSVRAADPMEYEYSFDTLDNGMNGLWATDHFQSKITITPTTEEGCFNVVREDGGTFTVLDDALSPGGDGSTLVGNGTEGTISGGVELEICGDLEEDPDLTWEDLTEGDYGDYYNKYFHKFFSEITSHSWIDWGWTFTTCNNGTWVDTDETEASWYVEKPNEIMGDITGDYVACKKNRQKATGGVTWTARTNQPLLGQIPGMKSEFEVHEGWGDKADWGMYKLHRPEVNGFASGDATIKISCVNIDGNQAWFAGTVTKAKGAYKNRVGDAFLSWIKDDGTPGSSGPDKIGGNWYNSIDQACNLVESQGWIGSGLVTGGNLVVHNN